MDKSSNTTSEYEARAEAYRAKARECQRWLDHNEADEDEVARAIEARDAYEAAAEAMIDETTTYTADGAVRGGCGHAHSTIAAAAACVARDRLACASNGGGAYSDRTVVRVDGRPFELDELDELDRY